MDNENNQPEVKPVHEAELTDRDRMFVMQIHFECQVRACDYAPKPPYTKREFRPQWFKLHLNISLETIERDDARMLGLRLKEAYDKLKDTIKQYEQYR